MQIKTQKLIWFSPTGTSRQIAIAVGEGIGAATRILDITLPSGRMAPATITEDLVVIAVPVYVGGIPQLAASYLSSLSGKGKPVVLLAVYGNRAYENALTEMKEACTSMIPVAAGAFFAEHSFADEQRPLANGRPDAKDLALARKFGQQVMAKLAAVEELSQMLPLAVPTAIPFKARMKVQPPFVPDTGDQCNLCGICAGVCPTGAIDPVQPAKVDPTLCLRCFACVRNCPLGAKQFTNPSFQEHIDYLSKNFHDPKQPEVFI